MATVAERQRQNVARARAGFDAFNRGDLEGVLAVLAEDIEVFSSPALPNSGTFRPVDMRVAYMLELGDERTKALHLYPSWAEAVAAAERRDRGAHE